MDNELDRKRKQFFALCNELKLDPEVSKERAKKFFGNVESFNDLDLSQLKILITKLQAKKDANIHI